MRFDENNFLGSLFVGADLQNRDFSTLTEVASGIGIFKQNQENPDEIGMVGRSAVL